MKNSVKPGIYVGVINIIIALLVYLLNPAIFAKMWFGLGIIAINIGLVIYFGLQYRKQEEGYLTFKEGFSHGFFLLLVAGLIGLVFNILLFSVIDPELSQIVTDAMVIQTESMLKGFGMQGADLDKAIEQVKADTPARFTVAGQLKSFGFSIIGYLVVALITGAIVKKSEPEF